MGELAMFVDWKNDIFNFRIAKATYEIPEIPIKIPILSRKKLC